MQTDLDNLKNSSLLSIFDLWLFFLIFREKIKLLNEIYRIDQVNTYILKVQSCFFI